MAAPLPAASAPGPLARMLAKQISLGAPPRVEAEAAGEAPAAAAQLPPRPVGRPPKLPRIAADGSKEVVKYGKLTPTEKSGLAYLVTMPQKGSDKFIMRRAVISELVAEHRDAFTHVSDSTLLRAIEIFTVRPQRAVLARPPRQFCRPLRRAHMFLSPSERSRCWCIRSSLAGTAF